MNDFSELIGQRLGIFHIERVIGRGGMGVVFQAIDTNLHRPVALKVLPREFSFDESFVARFILEARAAAQLNHGNIVTIYAVGEQNGIHYIAMEYIQGETLEERLKKTGPLAPDQALRILRQTGEALREAHGRKMIHRDIKPSNIMLDAKGVARVMDFGLVRAQGTISKLTVAGTLMGTPAYIAPEVYNNENVDHRVDIYALGITFFEMLTGRTPFQSDTPAGMMYHALNSELPIDKLKKIGVPVRSIRLIEAMTRKDPDNRIKSAQELITAIDSGRIPKSATPPGGISTPTILRTPSVPKLPALPEMPKIKLPTIPKLPAISRKIGFGLVGLLLVIAAIYGLTRLMPETQVEQEVAAPTTTLERVIPEISVADWRSPGSNAPSERWTIEDKAFIAAPEEGTPAARLESLDWWRDFRLELEIQGGVDSFGAINLRDGVRIELRTTPGEETTASSTLEKDPYGEVTAQAEFVPGEWHHLLIAAEGNRIRLTLNKDSLQGLIKTGESSQPGPIALEVSSGELRFRAIDPRSFDIPEQPLRRPIEFPENRSLGDITMWVRGEFLTANIPWMGEAKGPYTIPRGMEYGLMPADAILQKLAVVDLVPDSSINGLIIASSPFEPLHMDRLMQLPNLTKLLFVKSSVRDEHIAGLPRLPNLHQLVISEEINITNASLEALPQIPWLKALLVENCNVTAERVDLAEKFPTLRALSLRGCRLNRRSLELTGQMDHLEYLDLSDTAAPGDIVEIIARMPSLNALDLSLCSLMDNDVLSVIFGDASNIRNLNVSYTGITREGLLAHAKSETLETLSCLGIGCTREDLALLKKALPNCEIKF